MDMSELKEVGEQKEYVYLSGVTAWFYDTEYVSDWACVPTGRTRTLYAIVEDENNETQ